MRCASAHQAKRNLDPALTLRKVRLLDVVGNTSISDKLMGLKRSRDEAMADNKPEQPASPYVPMFEGFRKELDEHHDRRERIVKASRDITASSKKM